MGPGTPRSTGDDREKGTLGPRASRIASRTIADVVGVIIVISFLVFAGWLALVTMYGDEREAAKGAIREAYERGDMGPEQYAAAMRALDEAA